MGSKITQKSLFHSLAIGLPLAAVVVFSVNTVQAHHSGPALVSEIKGYGLAVGKRGSIACNDGKSSTLSYARRKLPNYSVSHSGGFWKFKRNK